MIRGRVCPGSIVLGDCALGGQVAEHQLRAWEEDQQQEEEEEEARQAERLTDTLLQQEAKTMAKRGYRPKVGSLQGTGPAAEPPPNLAPAVPGLFVALCSARVLPRSSSVSPFLGQ